MFKRKRAVKHRYKITFLNASGLTDGSNVKLSWKRGAKSQNQGETPVKTVANGEVSWNHSVSILCTLFGTSSGGFEEKDLVIELIEVPPSTQKKAKKIPLGKTVVNLSDLLSPTPGQVQTKYHTIKTAAKKGSAAASYSVEVSYQTDPLGESDGEAASETDMGDELSANDGPDDAPAEDPFVEPEEPAEEKPKTPEIKAEVMVDAKPSEGEQPTPAKHSSKKSKHHQKEKSRDETAIAVKVAKDNEELAALKKESDELRKERDELKQTVDVMKKKQQKKSDELQKTKDELEQAKKDKKENKETIDKLQKEIEDLQHQIEDLQRKLDDSQRKIKQLEEASATSAAAAAAAAKGGDEAATALAALQSELNSTKAERDELKSNAEKAEADAAKAQAEAAKAAADAAKAVADAEKAAAEASESKSKNDKLKKDLKKQKKESQEEQEALKKQLEESQQRVKQLEEEAQKSALTAASGDKAAAAAVAGLQTELNNVKAERDSLKDDLEKSRQETADEKAKTEKAKKESKKAAEDLKKAKKDMSEAEEKHKSEIDALRAEINDLEQELDEAEKEKEKEEEKPATSTIAGMLAASEAAEKPKKEDETEPFKEKLEVIAEVLDGAALKRFSDSGKTFLAERMLERLTRKQAQQNMFDASRYEAVTEALSLAVHASFDGADTPLYWVATLECMLEELGDANPCELTKPGNDKLINCLKSLMYDAYCAAVRVSCSILERVTVSALLEKTPGAASGHSQQKTAQVIAVLADALKTCKAARLPQALRRSFVAQLVHGIDSLVVNALLTRQQFCCCETGFTLRMSMSNLESWLQRDPDTVAARKQLCHVREAVNFFVMDKTIFSDDSSVAAAFSALNIAQLARLLEYFHPDELNHSGVDTALVREMNSKAHAAPDCPLQLDPVALI